MSNTKQSNTNILTFTSNINSQRLSTNLRRILLQYISENKDYLPVDFDIQLNDINILLDFLDNLTQTKKKL